VLSDLHLGEEDSLLTPLDSCGEPNPSIGSNLWEILAGFLREITSKNREKPWLILLGDVVEFALSDPISAQKIFFEFLQYLVKDRQLFQRVIYIPGNHDHRVWELAKNAQYVSYVNRKGYEALKERPWNRTKCVASKDYHYVKPWFWERIEQEGIDLKILYPNYCIADEQTKKILLLHHGHFLEPIYCFLSNLRSIIFGVPLPNSVERLEEENHPWIEFLFSSFGFTGELGRDVETFYDMLQSPKKIETVMYKSGERLAETLIFKPAKRKLMKKILSHIFKFAVRFIYEVAERYKHKEIVSEKLMYNIQWYVNEPLRHQIAEELNEYGYEIKVFEKWIFVFGHTHKPFYKEWNVECNPYLEAFNTGSFVVDTPFPSSVYGAGLGIVNETLDTCMLSLRPSPSACAQKSYSILGKNAFRENFASLIQSSNHLFKLTEAYQREWDKRANIKRRLI